MITEITAVEEEVVDGTIEDPANATSQSIHHRDQKCRSAICHDETIDGNGGI